MEIIITGCGKVGTALASKLIDEGHNITVIDTNPSKIQRITEDFDVMGIVGNGSSLSVLSEANIENADVFIAVTGSDELNLLCCLFARNSSGGCDTIARVRNPIYSREIEMIKEQLGISTIINPELASAREISRLLRFPAASKIDTFAGGRVQLIKFELTSSNPLVGMMLKDIPSAFGQDTLICAVERGHEVIIPDGNFALWGSDIVTILAAPDKAAAFFKKLKMPIKPVKSTIIVGGGSLCYYLARDLIDNNINVRIIEQNSDRCAFLAELLPEADVIQGDGTDRHLLMAEGLKETEAFVALTGIDEENILMSMFSRKHSGAKLVTKVNRFEFDDILDGIDIGSIIYPKYITCDFIVQHVRALRNKSGSSIKTLYRILDDRVEALEFTVQENSKITGIPLSELKIRQHMLICCIARGDRIIIPRGSDMLHPGDNVIVVTLDKGLHDVREILAR